MAKGRVVWVIGTEAPAGREDEFHEWYNKVHLPMVLKIPGVLAATRYQAINPKTGQPTYLAIYELEDEKVLAVLRSAPEAKAAGVDAQEKWQGTMVTPRMEFYQRIYELPQ